MFFRMALLALIAVSVSCKKQRRTIVRGFSAPETAAVEAETKNDEKTDISIDDTTDLDSDERPQLQKVDVVEPAGIATGDLTIEAELPEANNGTRTQLQKVDVVEPAGIVTGDLTIKADLPETIEIADVEQEDMRESDKFRVQLESLFSKESLAAIRAEAVEEAQKEAVLIVNEKKLRADEPKFQSFQELLDSDEHGEVLRSVSLGINNDAGFKLVKRIIELGKSLDCLDCVINLEGMMIELDYELNVIVGHFSLTGEYQSESALYEDKLLPELSSPEITNQEKASLLAQVHYGEIQFVETEDGVIPQTKCGFTSKSIGITPKC